MFLKGISPFYSPSDIAFFEAAVEAYTNQIEQGVSVNSTLWNNRGLCKLYLGIAKKCVDILRSALEDFEAVISHEAVCLNTLASVKHNIALAMNALTLPELGVRQS